MSHSPQPRVDVATELSNVKALVDDALNSVRMLHPAITESMASDVLPAQLPEPANSLYQTLYHELDEARAALTELEERLALPRWKFLSGRLLLKEEYYALCADDLGWPDRGSLGLAGVSGLTDFELYTFFHYEDDQWMGLINPSESPRRKGRIGLRLGRPPEEIPLTGLRLDQRDFFAEFLPAVFTRFSR